MSAVPDGGDTGTGIPVTRWAVATIGVLLFLSVPLLVYLLVMFWPVHLSEVSSATAPGRGTQTAEFSAQWSPSVSIFGHEFPVPPEERFLYLVVIAAAIGSSIAVATSFTTYLGNQRLYTRWVWWYVLRLPIGIALSVLFYLAVRGGFFSSTSTETDVNPYGMAALGGLVGMFSKQASDKLQDVFEQLFNSTRNNSRGDKLT